MDELRSSESPRAAVVSEVSSFARARDIMLEEAAALFAERPFGDSRALSSSVVQTTTLLGAIGFGCPGMRGAVAMLGDLPLWRALAMPTLGDDVPDGMLADFVGELCNLLIGRFRNRLLRIGIDVVCSTPTAAKGANLELAQLTDSTSVWHALVTPGGVVHLRFDASFAPEFCFDAHMDKAVEPSDSMVMF